ncbi:MAG TPA: DUF485 domain-containing protein [Nitrospiria bacterium]|nr:DUF485 domain-containing protein [Nitrospiria bacterium]
MGRRDKVKRGLGRKSPKSDFTSSSGGETDVAPLGRAGAKPAHERTADEDVDVVDWDRVAGREDFRRLVAAKRAFIVPATVFFIAYYFALPLLVGYAPDLMKTEAFGAVNLAYLFALSQFVMAWGLAAWYLRAAGRFDGMAHAILGKLVRRKAG